MIVVAFDIETLGMPEPWDRKEPLAITCGAAVARGEGVDAHRMWWAGMEDYSGKEPVVLDGLVELAERGDLPLRAQMTRAEVERMLDGLLDFVSIVGGMSDEPTPLFTHNGVGFDFPAIAAMLPDRLDDIVDLMLLSYDILFHAVRCYGWRIGIDAIGQAMLGSGKPEDMNGAKAAVVWPIQASDVLRYVHSDCVLNIEVVNAIQAEKKIRWITKKGGETERPIDPPYNAKPRWLSVRDLMRRTYGVRKGVTLREPNRSWMDDPKGMEMDSIFAWWPEWKSVL